MLQEKIMQHLGANNVREYPVDGWPSEQEYLDRLSADFVEDMKTLINNANDEQKKTTESTSQEERMLLQEALWHGHKCVEKVRNFVGRQSLLERLRVYFSDPLHCNKPFVLHGKRSVGKSATMAAICFAIREWFSADSVVVVRFLGTSAESVDIFSTIRSITQQICAAYSLPVPRADENFGSLFAALTKFRSTIEEVSKKFAASRPLFILLDGLDQLASQRECLNTLWAICNLPLNVHAILSTVPMVGGVNLLGALSVLVTTQEASAEILPLNSEEAAALVQKIIPQQRKIGAIDKCLLIYSENQQPLHLTLFLNALSASANASHDDIVQMYGQSTEDSVQNNLDEACKEYKENIVKSFASYLTIYPNGIHEYELLELLTANDGVMEEVRQYCSGAADSRTSFPAGLLAALKHRLSQFVGEHYAFGQSLLVWRQREYYDIVSKYCDVIFPGVGDEDLTESATNKTLALYNELANFYIFANGELNSSSSDTALLPLEKQSNPLWVYRLPQLVKVFLPIMEPTELCQSVVFSLPWLVQSLSRSGGYKSLLNNVIVFIKLLEQVATESEGEVGGHIQCIKDLRAFVEFLLFASVSLKTGSPHLLVAEILGRLPRSNLPFAQKLVSEAEDWKKAHCSTVVESKQIAKPILLPAWSCLPPLGKPLRFRVDGPQYVLGVLKGGERMVTFNRLEGVDVWDLFIGDRLVRFPINREQLIEQVIPGHISEFVVVGFYSHLKKSMNVGVWSTETGVELVSASFPHQFELMALDDRDKVLVIVTQPLKDDDIHRENHGIHSERCIMAIDVQSRNVKYTFPVGEVHPDGITKLLFVKKQSVDFGYKLVTIGSKSSKDVAIWDLEAEEMLSSLEDVDCFVDFAVVVPGASEQVVCLSSTAGVLLQLNIQEEAATHRVQDDSLLHATDMAVTANGRYSLVVTKQHEIAVWSFETEDVTKTIKVTSDGTLVPITKLVLDSSEQFLYVGSSNGKVAVVCIGSTQVLQVLDGHAAAVCNLRTLTNNRLVSTADNSSCCVWQMAALLEGYKSQLSEEVTKKWEKFSQFESLPEVSPAATDGVAVTLEDEVVNKFRVASSGDSVITLGATGVVRCWDIHTGEKFVCVRQGS